MAVGLFGLLCCYRHGVALRMLETSSETGLEVNYELQYWQSYVDVGYDGWSLVEGCVKSVLHVRSVLCVIDMIEQHQYALCKRWSLSGAHN